jgi:hypothetical protein
MQTDREQPPAPVPMPSPAPLAPTPMMPPMWVVVLSPRPRIPAGEIWLRLAIAFALGGILLLPMEAIAAAVTVIGQHISIPSSAEDSIVATSFALTTISMLAPPMLLAIGSVFLDRDVWRDLRALRTLLAGVAVLLVVCGLALLGLFALGQGTDSQSDPGLLGGAAVGGFFLGVSLIGFIGTGCVAFAIGGRGLRETPLPLWFGPCAGVAALLGLAVNTMVYLAMGSLIGACSALNLGSDCGDASGDITIAILFVTLFVGVIGTVCTLPAAAAAGLVGGALRAQLPRLLFRPPRGER